MMNVDKNLGLFLAVGSDTESYSSGGMSDCICICTLDITSLM